ncbi:unnamed protein product [Sphagnum jensenii]
MVTIKVKDIAKLAGYLRIPLMAEGASVTDTIRQKMLYSRLPNQCQKCQRFEHQAQACNIVKNFAQEGAAHRALATRISDNKNQNTRPTTKMATRVRAQSSTAVPRHEAQAPTTHKGGTASKLPRNQCSVSVSGKDPYNTRSSRPSSDPEQRNTSAEAPENRSAIVPTTSPSRAEEGTRADGKKPPEGATTPRNSIFFDLPGHDDQKAQITEASTNPFASPADRNQEGDARLRNQEDMLEGWSFQGRRKHAPKLVSPRPNPRQVPLGPHNKNRRLAGKGNNSTQRYIIRIFPLSESTSLATANPSEQGYGRC